MKIGNIDIKNNVVLAPMAGVNCTSFRLMCKKHGCGLVCSQMYEVQTIIEINDKGVNELNNFLNVRDKERPIAIQLVGSIKDNWTKAVKIIEKYADIIDLNFGCPKRKQTDKMQGAYLSTHIHQIEKIAKIVVDNATIPVTAKIRSGWDNKRINAVEVAQALKKIGISAITIHPRTKKQKYTGKADWEIIKDVKNAINIPVIGNGDISLPGHAKSMIERTGCDAVMIGREAMKNPLIFEKINTLLKTGKNPFVKHNHISLVNEFIDLYEKYETDQKINEVRDHCGWLLSGYKKAKFLSDKIRNAETIDEIKKIISDFK